MRTYGYNDPELVPHRPALTAGRVIAIILAVLAITGIWMGLTQKLIFGDDWISATYDNEDWKTNEGNLHTFGAWDIESHIWKTEYIMEHWPNFQWNPYWYLGMPLLKYYQYGFYALNAGLALLTGASVARAALLLVIFGHLAAALLTFALCYKFSRRVFASLLCSVFVLANTFISLRSYGWEPITVVFMWLFPLGLLVFFRNPTRPFRLSLIVTLAIAYYSHPLLFFALCMVMGLYLASIAVRPASVAEDGGRHYLWQYFGAVVAALGLGAVQFFLQMSYTQVTSGAHMGIKYLPFYQVPFNIITLKDFFFDAGNLKGPGFVIMVATVLLGFFIIAEVLSRKKLPGRMVRHNELVSGLAFVVFMMVLLYYLELWNVFPMNLLRSIQYHRIIPEFIITAAALIAVMANIAYTRKQRTFYYGVLVSFALASGIVIFGVQTYWETTPSIHDSQEFIYDEFEGRISHPYTDQSLAVRSSFTEIPQVYGYYEQGITNSYDDELFSVSSGYHNAENTILYLQAANVARLYTNMDEGDRDEIVRARLNSTLEHVWDGEHRYGYFEIPLADAHLTQAVSASGAERVKALAVDCRELYQEHYCGSVGEEFVTRDPEERRYLRAYVNLLGQDHSAEAKHEMVHPQLYRVNVTGATADTAVVVKMTHDRDFVATIDGREVDIETFGPDFMLVSPGLTGDYVLELEYRTPREALAGLGVAAFTLVLLLSYFIASAAGVTVKRPRFLRFPEGDMQ